LASRNDRACPGPGETGGAREILVLHFHVVKIAGAGAVELIDKKCGNFAKINAANSADQERTCGNRLFSLSQFGKEKSSFYRGFMSHCRQNPNHVCKT
jgi:hypothetical protein